MSAVFAFIIVLGVLILVHELGHFLVAKLFRVRVLTFALGFGPRLFSLRGGETDYQVRAFPLGGYVKMLGEQPDEPVPEELRPRSFSAKPVWQRLLIVLAGPLSNLAAAVAIFSLVALIGGIPHPLPTTAIGQVAPGSPADQAGVRAEDVITAINGQKVSDWPQVFAGVKASGGRPVTLALERAGKAIEITATPAKSPVKNLFGEVVEHRYLLGITQKEVVRYEPATIVAALLDGLAQTRFYIEFTALSLWKIIQRVVPASQLGGPILIAQMAGQQLKTGWLHLMSFMAVLSVNLGIINLFPIPILDGGHILFFSVEALRRKPLTLRAQGLLQQVGIALLGSLMLLAFYNDLARLFAKG